MKMKAFPDCHSVIDDIFGTGDRVCVRLRQIGTNEGGLPLFDLPPNGKRHEVPYISIYRVADGKVAEHWSGMNFLEVIAQLSDRE
jgi:predicted ester cyclase